MSAAVDSSVLHDDGIKLAGAGRNNLRAAAADSWLMRLAKQRRSAPSNSLKNAAVLPPSNSQLIFARKALDTSIIFSIPQGSVQQREVATKESRFPTNRLPREVVDPSDSPYTFARKALDSSLYNSPRHSIPLRKHFVASSKGVIASSSPTTTTKSPSPRKELSPIYVTRRPSLKHRRPSLNKAAAAASLPPPPPPPPPMTDDPNETRYIEGDKPPLPYLPPMTDDRLTPAPKIAMDHSNGNSKIVNKFQGYQEPSPSLELGEASEISTTTTDSSRDDKISSTGSASSANKPIEMIRSILKSNNINDDNVAAKRRKQKKNRVQFFPRVQWKGVAPLDELTENSDLSIIWYQPEEFDAIHAKILKIAAKVRAEGNHPRRRRGSEGTKKSSKITCIRGLERTIHQDRFQALRMEALDLVLDLQFSTSSGTSATDPEIIAERYKNATTEARMRAIYMAAQDADDAAMYNNNVSY